MLSNDVMGVLALAILWINTLLVAGAGMQRLRKLRSRIAELASGTDGGGVVLGTPREEEGPIAKAIVEQVGRYGAGGGRSIVWQDRVYRSEILGGVVDTERGPLRLEPTDENALVWVDPSSVAGAAKCPSPEAFDQAFVLARKAKGFRRTVESSVRGGERIWIAGTEMTEGEVTFLRSAPGRPLLVSSLDPIAWCKKKVWFLGAVFIPGVVLGAGLCTAIALVPPHFGTVSMIGAGLGLLFFLLVLPAGTAARDYVREPHEAILRGEWKEEKQRERGTETERVGGARG